MRKSLISVAIIAILIGAGPATASETVHHDLEVRLGPDEHHLRVIDTVVLGHAVTADEQGGFRFVLHAGLNPRVETPGWELQEIPGPVEAGFFGINARADVCLYLLANRHGSSNGIAREIGFDQKVVYRILERWVEAGVVDKEPRRHYVLALHSALEAMLGRRAAAGRDGARAGS